MVLTVNVKKCATAAGMSYDTLSTCFNDPDEAWELEQHFAALSKGNTEAGLAVFGVGVEADKLEAYLQTQTAKAQGR